MIQRILYVGLITGFCILGDVTAQNTSNESNPVWATLSMTDKERMDVVERCHSKIKRYRNLVSYYTNKNISVSYLRAKKKNDLDRIMGLYGSMNERYW